MRFLPKTVMLTVAIIGVAAYVGYLKTGTSVWRLWEDRTAGKVVAVKERIAQAWHSVRSAAVQDDVGTVIYKWVDIDGVLQYSNVLPSPDIAVEVVVIDPQANLVPAIVAPARGMDNKVAVESSTDGNKPTSLLPYTPEQLKESLDDARNAQQMMNQKLEHQQQVLDKL